MTIPLTGAGSYFVRIGHLLGRLADTNSLGGGTATTNVISTASMPTKFATIESDFAAGTALIQVIDGLINGTLVQFQSSNQNLWQPISTYVQNTLRAMVAIDTLGVPSNAPLSQLLSASLQYSLQTLVSQMTTASASINASVPAFGSQTAVGSPTGNPVIFGSMIGPNGLTLQYIYPETLTFACTRDALTGGAIAGSEQMSVVGYPQVQSSTSPLWPGGSGVNSSINLIDGSKNYSGSPTANLLQNSDFATATTVNLPDNWNAVTGVVGTDIFQDAGNAYTTGGGSLKFLGTVGAVNDCVTQTFNKAPVATLNSGGTSYALTPNTVYIGNLWIKTTSVPAAGVLRAAFVYGSGTGTIFNDQNAVANSATFDLTSGGLNIGNTYTPIQFVFRTPAVLPATTPYSLRFDMSTPITNGKALWMGRLALTSVPIPLYTGNAGGPYGPVGFSGNVNVIGGTNPDSWTMGVTNTQGKFQAFIWRTMNPIQYGLTIPNSGSPSVSDTLLV